MCVNLLVLLLVVILYIILVYIVFDILENIDFFCCKVDNLSVIKDKILYV